MFKQHFSRPPEPTQKPEDERKIEKDARQAIRTSRDQIDRAREILKKEVHRLDEILSRG